MPRTRPARAIPAACALPSIGKRPPPHARTRRLPRLAPSVIGIGRRLRLIGGECVGWFRLEVRHPVQPAGQVPTALTEQAQGARQDDQADQGGVQDQGYRDAEAHLLELEELPPGETGEHGPQCDQGCVMVGRDQLASSAQVAGHLRDARSRPDLSASRAMNCRNLPSLTEELVELTSIKSVVIWT